jgi:hypothetical protein
MIQTMKENGEGCRNGMFGYAADCGSTKTQIGGVRASHVVTNCQIIHTCIVLSIPWAGRGFCP